MCGDRLVDDREDPTDDRLRGDDRCCDHQDEEWNVENFNLGKDHLKERISHICMPEQEGCLSQVGCKDRDKDKNPGISYRFPAQMAHVCEECFSTGCTEYDEGHCKKSVYSVMQKELGCIYWIDSSDDLWA